MGTTYRVAVSARKGGCGKTAVSVLLTRELVRQGARVLALDLDPQGASLSRRLATEPDGPLSYTAVDLVLGSEGRPFAPVEMCGGRLAVIPSNFLEVQPLERHLLMLQMERTAAFGPGARRVVLDARLAAVEVGYDVVVMDTPTDFGERITNALEAADLVISPVDTRTCECRYSISDMELAMREVHRKPLLRYLANQVTTRVQGRAGYEETVKLCGDRLLVNLALPYSETVMQSMALQDEMKASRDVAAVVKNHISQLAEMVLQLARGEGQEAKPVAEVLPLVSRPPSVLENAAEESPGAVGGQS